MRAQIVRAVLAAAVLSAGIVGFVVAGGVPGASADTVVITPPDSWYTFSAFLNSVSDLVVDPVHQRLIAADPVDGLISASKYDGSFGGSTVTGLPGVSGLALSADSATLYATVPSLHAVVAYSTATYTETKRFTLSDSVFPRDVVVDGGLLWFSYDDNVSSGNFGSINPVSGVVTRHSFTGISPFYQAPMITANPSAPGRIVLSQDDYSEGDPIAVYDVSDGAERLIAMKSIDGLDFPRDLALSADGSQIVVAGAGGVLQLSSTDLSTVGAYLTDNGMATDIAADGRVAVADRTDVGTPDLYTYAAGSTTPLQEFDMPFTTFSNYAGPDKIVQNGIVWQPDGPRLFVVTENDGIIGFRALDEPVATAITVKAPATADRAKPLAITGTITGPVPAGTKLTVTRSDLASTGLALPAATTDAAGKFTITDTPPAGGSVVYSVSYAGDYTHQAAKATTTVAVSRATPSVTINRNGTVNAYGATVALTAHLGSTYSNRTAEIWADPAGSDQANRLLKKAVVTSAGNVTVNLRLTRNTVVTAIFRGDARYAPRTVTANLSTKVAVSTAVTKQYKTSGGYYTFHKTKNPVFTTTMTASPKRKQQLAFQYYSGGAWHAWRSSLLTLSSAGKSAYTLTGTHKTAVKYRVRADYINGSSGDTLNTTTYGSYHYFTFTK